MKIESVDAFYLRLPKVSDIGDGSQDALLIRVRAGGFTGWGECEASPLPTIAALVAPMSHSACKPVLASVLGAEISGPDDIRALHRRVKENSLDLLQTDHALSGIDIAFWDLLGKREKAPVWSFFGSANHPRIGYASSLFGASPAETFERASSLGPFRAAKFGWGPIGRGSAEEDRLQIEAARSGLGPDKHLLIDTGCVFGHDVERALQLAPALEKFRVGWWEEPFATGALREYRALSESCNVPLAGGEGCHSADQARHYLDHAGVSFLQIDAGRVGGITASREVAEAVRGTGVQFVNHTFTSPLALSASLQPYADDPSSRFAEVPVHPSSLAAAIGSPLSVEKDGFVRAPEDPGLGMEIDLDHLRPYLQDVRIEWEGRVLWETVNLE